MPFKHYRPFFRLASIALSLGISVFLTSNSFAASTPIRGDLIKGPSDAVYYYGQDGKRYVFPNPKTYHTWYPDFSSVKFISTTALSTVPVGGNVTYRPGARLVKIATVPKVYAVASRGTLRWVKTETLAQALYGSDWNKKIDDIPEVFFGDYVIGTDISSMSDFSPSLEMATAKDISTDKKLGAPSSASAIWSPQPSATFQWQLSGNFDASVNAQVYDLDLFETSRETIAGLHAKGKRVICYVSVGTWEDWRPDQNAFPAQIIGKGYPGWPGEKWLDIRRLDLLGPVLQKRFDLARDKGCDAIEPDNMDAAYAETGFPLTSAHQSAFNKWVAQQAHQRMMSVGLKNNPELVPELLPHFDWALVEDCHSQGWCSQMLPFSRAGKVVFQVEYTDSGIKLEEACRDAKQNGFVLLYKHRELDAWMQRCV